MKSQVAFIIPAYNASKTIVRCLDSIYAVGLSEQEFEVICIDDCSTDNTVGIIEQYAEQHTNLTLLCQSENHRQGAARNRGVEIAKSAYIMFVDSDDEIVNEGIINALNAVTASQVDVCYFDFIYEDFNGQWIKYSMPNELKQNIMASNNYLEDYYNFQHNAPWRNLYKSSFLTQMGIKFIEDVQFEDGDWTLKVYLAAQNVQFVSGIGYKYYWGENATSRKVSAESMFQRIFSGIRLLQIGELCKLPKLRNKLIEYVQYSSFSLLRLRSLTKYSFCYCMEVFERLNLTYIHTYARSFWQRNILSKHPLLAKFILFFACPIASVGRKIVNLKRKYS